MKLREVGVKHGSYELPSVEAFSKAATLLSFWSHSSCVCNLVSLLHWELVIRTGVYIKRWGTIGTWLSPTNPYWKRFGEVTELIFSNVTWRVDAWIPYLLISLGQWTLMGKCLQEIVYCLMSSVATRVRFVCPCDVIMTWRKDYRNLAHDGSCRHNYVIDKAV